MAKKKSKKPALSKASFKTTGKHATMRVDDKKKKTYYFAAKIDGKKATKIAESDVGDIFGVSSDSVKLGRPSLKYDFYCLYDAELELSFLRLRNQELGVNEQVKGVLVGGEVMMPKKGKDIPGPAIRLDIVELFEMKRTDGMLLDGKTGGEARMVEKTVKGSGKKRASPAWIKKQRIGSGKYNSVEKVAKAVAKMASQKPSDAKRVVTHNLTFKKIEGYYIPVYYISATAGGQKKTVKVNGIDSSLSLDV
jgi:hypothetical protein